MSANGGLGEVIQKNVQLHNYKSADGLTAIKHGNGRDWWIINRRWNNINNTFYKYLIWNSKKKVDKLLMTSCSMFDFVV